MKTQKTNHMNSQLPVDCLLMLVMLYVLLSLAISNKCLVLVALCFVSVHIIPAPVSGLSLCVLLLLCADCPMSDWSVWSQCSCESQRQQRHRVALSPATRGQQCTPLETQSRACNLSHCHSQGTPRPVCVCVCVC